MSRNDDQLTVEAFGIDEILLSTARSLLQAQRAMDATSLAAERRLRELGPGESHGWTASWYAIPELELDLRLALGVGSSGEIHTDIVDADYQSRYGFDVEASSELRTKFVAVPPPRTQGISLLDEAEVLRRVGRLKRIVEAWDRADAPRLIARYHAFTDQGYTGGVWNALLLDRRMRGGLSLQAWVAIDDRTGDVLRSWILDNEEE